MIKTVSSIVFQRGSELYGLRAARRTLPEDTTSELADYLHIMSFYC